MFFTIALAYIQAKYKQKFEGLYIITVMFDIFLILSCFRLLNDMVN